MTSCVKDFIFSYAKMISAYPEDLQISEEEKDGCVEILILARAVDAGRLIGKGGKVIGACKNIAVSGKNLQKINYKITVKTIDE